MGSRRSPAGPWTTTSDTRDFRKSKWEKGAKGVEVMLANSPNAAADEPPLVVLNLPIPATGYAAGFTEFTFDIDGTKFNLSTPITIAEAKK